MLVLLSYLRFLFVFFNDTATTEIYTLSLHDALPICSATPSGCLSAQSPTIESCSRRRGHALLPAGALADDRSEEHTSELQSRLHLVCRLLLEKKKKKQQHSRSKNIPRHSTNHHMTCP